MHEKSIIFACHTYYHLYVSTIYSKNLKKINKRTVLIWYGDIENPFMYKMNEAFDVVYNIGNLYNKENKSNKNKRRFITLRLFSLFRYIKLFSISIKEFKFGRVQKLCIFSDVPVEAQFLLTMSKRYNQSIDNILIDEGIGLYLNKVEKKTYTKTFYKLLNVFRFKPYDNIAIGEHNLLDVIIAKEPNELPLKIQNSEIEIITQSIKALFNIEESRWFLKLIDINIDEIYTKPEKTMLVIGQPLKFIGIDERRELDVWMEIFRMVPDEYMILIKPHPSDTKNKYNSLLNVRKNTKIIDGEYSLIPIELLFGSFNTITTISAFSSATVNSKYINNKIRNIFIYKLLGVSEYHKDETINNLLSKNGVTLNDITDLPYILQDFTSKHGKIENLCNYVYDDSQKDMNYIKS